MTPHSALWKRTIFVVPIFTTASPPLAQWWSAAHVKLHLSLPPASVQWFGSVTMFLHSLLALLSPFELHLPLFMSPACAIHLRSLASPCDANAALEPWSLTYRMAQWLVVWHSYQSPLCIIAGVKGANVLCEMYSIYRMMYQWDCLPQIPTLSS